MNERKKQQVDLIFKLGLLLAPLREIADHPEKHDATSRSRAQAKVVADAPRLEMELNKFATGEPGHKYQSEWMQCHKGTHFLQNHDFRQDNPEILSDLLDKSYNLIRDALMSIPVPDIASILRAYTPFSTYCVLKDLFQTTTQKLVLCKVNSFNWENPANIVLVRFYGESATH